MEGLFLNVISELNKIIKNIHDNHIRLSDVIPSFENIKQQ